MQKEFAVPLLDLQLPELSREQFFGLCPHLLLRQSQVSRQVFAAASKPNQEYLQRTKNNIKIQFFLIFQICNLLLDDTLPKIRSHPHPSLTKIMTFNENILFCEDYLVIFNHVNH